MGQSLVHFIIHSLTVCQLSVEMWQAVLEYVVRGSHMRLDYFCSLKLLIIAGPVMTTTAALQQDVTKVESICIMLKL